MKSPLQFIRGPLATFLVIFLMAGCRTSSRETIDLEAGFLNLPDSRNLFENHQRAGRMDKREFITLDRSGGCKKSCRDYC